MAVSDAGDDQEQEQPGTMHPALQAFTDAFPQGAEQQPWVNEVTTRLNDWVQRRDIADENTAAANEYVNNIGQFKSGLVSMVTADPTATHVALDIVAPTMHALMPANHPEESYDDTHSSLTGHIQGEVAHAAVTSMAERDGGAARSLLDNDRIAGLFDDDQKAGLNHYISAQEIARGADQNAAQREAQLQQERVQNATLHSYAGELVNPASGQVSFPADWGKRITADTTLRPEDKGELMHMYGRLQTNGDAKSDPMDLLAAIQQANAPVGREGMNPFGLVGNKGDENSKLSLRDAVWLNGLQHTETTEGQLNRQRLAETVDNAWVAITGKDNEYGAAGKAAFGRFMDWFAPAYQKIGPDGLNPDSENFLFKNTNVGIFRPTGDDIVLGRRPGHPDMPGVNPNAYTQDRVSLEDIFGGKRRAPSLDKAPLPPVEMKQPGEYEMEPFKTHSNPEQDT